MLSSSAAEYESPHPPVAAVPSSDSPPGNGSDREPGEGAASASDPTFCSNFSIREYVFRSRSKDIYTNWPFSRENLQLCLRHGVTEVLPPFQRLHAVKCQSFEISKFENRSFVGKDCVADFQTVPSNSKSKVPSPDCAAEDNVPSVATRASRASPKQLPTKAAIPPASFKSGSSAQTASKKCRLVVKFGAKSERSSGDDAASNCTGVSENMASKVCPVCKTFSSSSNTTLNAHIDQCLSLGSLPKGLAVRHKIKPRKTRLMMDIYETAKRCTIEELNRRNGLTCANSSTVAAPTVDAESGEERRIHMQMVRAGDPSDAGAVYIDANGTKLRILSKFNDAGSKKSSQGNKGIEIFKKKTKKLRGQKHYKYLKLASKGKKHHSMKPHDSQLFAERKNLHRTQGDGEESRGHAQWSQGPLKPGVSVTLRKWSSSKRTGLKKKLAAKEDENPQKCQLLHLAQDSLDESDQTSLVSRMPTRGRSFSLLDMSENSGFSQSFDSEKERPWHDCRSFEWDQTAVCKRSLAWSDVTTDSIEKWSFQKLRKDNHLQEVNRSNIGKPAGHDKSPVRQKKGVDIQLRPRSFSRKALRFSTLRKRALSLCQSSENSSDVSVGQRDFSLKKPKQNLTGEACHMIEDLAQGRSVEEDTGFEMMGLPEVAESCGISEKVRYSKSDLNDTLDAEPSGDAVEDCTWGLTEYYDSAHLNHSDSSWTNAHSRQFLGIANESLCGVEDDISRAYNACDVVNEENADGKTDEGYCAGQSSSFVEIDPIPIPGPPGSFLPSPGSMGLDDFQGNSSLTTSQAQSSLDHWDLVEGNASDSPASATSTVSNSAEAKWGMDYSEDPWTGFSSAGTDSSSIQQSASAKPSSSPLAAEGKKANDVFIKKGPRFTRDGDEPCCCQKKDSLRRQTDWILNCTGRLEVGSEGSVAEAVKSSTMSSSMRFGELSNGTDHADCDFLNPSGSNPVLRLMGKDLIVVNQEDDAAMLDQSHPTKIRDSQSTAVRGIPRAGDQNHKEYRYKETDYTSVQSLFMGSSSGYLGQFDSMTKVAAPINPSKEEMATDDAYRKKSPLTSSAYDNGNLPRDAIRHPQALTPCEPVAELASSHPKGSGGFRGSKSVQDKDGLLLPQIPSFAVAPQFLGRQGSGFAYYPSFS